LALAHPLGLRAHHTKRLRAAVRDPGQLNGSN
jgi:hypothetical protein